MTCKECYHNEVCEALYEMNGVPRIFACQCAYFRNAADVVEVRHGEWKYNRGQAPNEKAYFCSLCAYGESDYGRDKYCPNCGARMDGERREG